MLRRPIPLLRTRASRRLATALVAVVGVAAPACTSTATGGATPLSVFAASSLTESFEALERDFEAEHPSIDLQLTFAGSQVLRLQIEQGAPADVFASANEAHLEALAAADITGPRQTFATGGLVVIVPASNPAGIQSFAQLPDGERIVVGTPDVPVGVYTRQMLDRAANELGPQFAARVRAHVVSEESNVRLVRAKVELGEADAAIVYGTEAAASTRVDVVPIPASIDVRARYSIATVLGSARLTAAKTFTDHVLSDAGQQTLHAHGFAVEDR